MQVRESAFACGGRISPPLPPPPTHRPPPGEERELGVEFGSSDGGGGLASFLPGEVEFTPINHHPPSATANHTMDAAHVGAAIDGGSTRGALMAERKEGIKVG